MGMKSKSDILNTSSPPTSYSSTHYCTSSSEVVISKGSSRADGSVTVELLLLSYYVALASHVVHCNGTYYSSYFTSSSPSGMGSRIDGKGTILLIILFLFLMGVLIFLHFLEAKGDAYSIYKGGDISWVSSSVWLDAAGGTYGSN